MLVGVAVLVAVGTGVSVAVGVTVGVMVTVGNGVGVCEGVGVMLAVGRVVGSAVGLPWSGFWQPPRLSPTKMRTSEPEITHLVRLIIFGCLSGGYYCRNVTYNAASISRDSSRRAVISDRHLVGSQQT